MLKMKNNKAIVCLSFDDGRKDFYDNAFPILKKYGLTASLNVTTGYVDKTFKPSWPTSYGACTKEELLELKKYGIEIAYHGDQHITSEDDFENARKKFIKWNLHENEMGFAVPGSYLENVDVKSFIKYLEKENVKYMRIDNNKKHYFFYRVFRKLYNVTGNKTFYKLYNKSNIMDLKNINRYDVPSVIVFEKDNPENIVELIKLAINKNGVVVLMLHGILDENDKKYGKDEYAWSTRKFEMLCRTLSKFQKDGKVKVINLIDLFK